MNDLASESGWGFPQNSRKAHYFRESRSLCGKWLYFGRNLGEAAGPGPDDCKACWKKLNPEAVLRREVP